MDILLVVNVQYHCNHFNMAFKNKVSIHTFLYRFKFVQWREREREREKKEECNLFEMIFEHHAGYSYHLISLVSS